MKNLFVLVSLLVITASNAYNPLGNRFMIKNVVSVSNPVTDSRTGRDLKLRMTDTSGYWEGEWICADCGYIYDRNEYGGVYFEQQGKGFICPQCRGPRRRYAKKVGDKVGVTRDGGDGPILLFSFLGLAATIAFGVWFSQQ